MLENGGDVYEAAEECYGMIWWLAGAVAERVLGTAPPSREAVLDVIAQAAANYRDGLAAGGVQKPR